LKSRIKRIFQIVLCLAVMMTSMTVPSYAKKSKTTTAVDETTTASTETTVASKETTTTKSATGVYQGVNYTLSYVETADGLEISKYSGNAKTVEIPSEIDGKKVNSIGYCAFDTNMDINTVVIHENITELCESSFDGCDNMTVIYLPKSLQRVERYSFYMCRSLSKVKYAGTEEDFGKIIISDDSNSSFISAAKEYSQTYTASVFSDIPAIASIVCSGILFGTVVTVYFVARRKKALSASHTSA